MTWRTTPRETDLAEIGALVAATGFFSEEERRVAVDLVTEALARGPESGYEFVFAEEAGEVGQLIGYACYGPIPATDSSFDLYWIAVSPRHQRGGIGRRLLNEVERLARQQGATQMFVDTSARDQYAPTRAFYESSGYRRSARIENFYAPGDDKIIYSKPL